MTFALLTPEEQQAVWFLGSLAHVRLGGAPTDGQLAVVHHEGERGFLVARYVTLHTPAEASDLAELDRVAREHSIEILGPPPLLEEALRPSPTT